MAFEFKWNITFTYYVKVYLQPTKYIYSLHSQLRNTWVTTVHPKMLKMSSASISALMHTSHLGLSHHFKEPGAVATGIQYALMKSLWIRNNETRSPNHCCCGKAISITSFCVCVNAWGCPSAWMRVRACSLAYPACNAYAPRCDVICGPSSSTIFFDIIS